MASVALLLYRAAPGAPAIILTGLTGFTGLAALALAFTLDDAALPKFTRAVAAGVAIVVLCALVSPDARLRLASFASAAFGVGLAVWLARTARKRPSVSWPLAALFAVTLACLSAYAAYLVLVSRDLMIADFMTYRGIAMMVARLGRRGRLAAAARRGRPVHHARLFLGAGIGSRLPAGPDRADVARHLHLRAARPLRRAGRFGARDPGARLRAPRGACARRAADHCSCARRRRRVRRLPCGNGGRRARHARRRRSRAGCLRAQAGRAPRPLARVAARPRRARQADDPPRRYGAGADPVRDVRVPALVCVRRGGNRRHAGARGRLHRAEERRALSLEGRGRGGRARRPHAARALKPGPRRLGAELERA